MLPHYAQSDALELSEELVLLSPLQLHCLPAEGNHQYRFTLSAGDAPPVELAADSEEERQRWMFHIGESVCSPAPSPPTVSPPGSPSSVRAAAPLGSPILGSPTVFNDSFWTESSRSSSPGCVSDPLQGPVRFACSRVADNYSMGKVLYQGDDYMIVEGLHLTTHRSHVLKLLSKQSPRFRRSRDISKRGLGPRVCYRLLSQCIEEVYEGPNHVAMVMHWGTHELDAHHDLSAAVLEALRLLRELLPPSELPREGLKLGAMDTQKLMARLFALDSHLQANLFI